MLNSPINYRCDLSDTKTRKIKVEMNVNLPEQDGPLEVYLPHLSPGSLISSQGHPSSLVGFQALDAKGEKLPFEKLVEGGWRVNAKGPVTFRYDIKAPSFSDVRDQLTDENAYLNGPATFLAVRGHERDLPATLALENLPNPEWKSSSTLPRVINQPHTFYASNYDDIADDNIMLGDFKEATAKAGKTTLRVTQQGTAPYSNLPIQGVTPEENVHDLGRIYRALLHNFGEFPNQRYRINGALPEGIEPGKEYVVHKHYLHSGPDQTDGFEHYHGHEMIRHKNSEGFIKRNFEGSARMNENCTMAHEAGHVFTAKAVQHQGIDASNLNCSQRTDGLWVTEGVTNFIGYMLERQTGLITSEQYIKRWEGVISDYKHDYAANPSNAREDSMEAQLGNFKYYNKGSLIGLSLDMEIRQMSGGQKSFTDVLRALKAEFGNSGNYHSLDDMRRLTVGVAAPYPGGADLINKMYDDYLVDRKEMDLAKHLAHVGYQVVEKTDGFPTEEMPLAGARVSTDSQGRPSLRVDHAAVAAKDGGTIDIPGLGLTLASTGGVQGVIEGGPAYNAGLDSLQFKYPQSVLLRTADGDVDLRNPSRDVSGDQVQSVVFHYEDPSVFTGQNRHKEIVVPLEPAKRVVLEEVPHPTTEQLALREGWLAQLPENVLDGSSS